MRAPSAAIWLALALCGAQQGAAQEVPAVPQTLPERQAREPDVVRSPILTVDPEEIFARSLFGRRVTEELQARTAALAEENRRIAAELRAEEQDLTERRPGMDPAAFRAEAEAFDEKVQQIRRTQDAKEEALSTVIQDAQGDFLEAARPVLGRLMVERGAAVILDRRSVFLGVDVVDITAEAVARIDAAIGDGVPDEGGAATDGAPAAE